MNMLEGIDVSVYQGDIDWLRAAADGVHFAFARVSDGVAHPDGKFTRNWERMASACVVRGAYQFLRPKVDGAAQAALVVRAINDAGGLRTEDLPPVCDLEAMDGCSSQRVVDCACAWATTVEEQLAVAPILYAGPYFVQSLGTHAQRLARFPSLWVADYRAQPHPPSPWTDWAFWQYTDKGKVAGISGNVDMDWFQGSLLNLADFVAMARVLAAPAPPEAP